MGHNSTCCRCLTFIKLLNSITCPGSGPLPVCRSRLQQLLVHGPQREGPRLPLAILETLPQPLAAGISTMSNSGFRGFELIRQPEEPASNESPQGSEQPPPGIACEPLVPPAVYWELHNLAIYFLRPPVLTSLLQRIKIAVANAKRVGGICIALLLDMAHERLMLTPLMLDWTSACHVMPYLVCRSCMSHSLMHFIVFRSRHARVCAAAALPRPLRLGHPGDLPKCSCQIRHLTPSIA